MSDAPETQARAENDRGQHEREKHDREKHERHEQEIKLPIARVVLYEDRAEVIREGDVDLPGGPARLRLAGLTPLVNDRRLVTTLEPTGGAAVIDDARVEHHWITSQRADDARLLTLQDEIEQREDEARQARQALERLTERRAATEIAFSRYTGEISRGLTRDAGDRETWERAFASFERALAFLDGEIASARDALAEKEREAERLRGLVSLGSLREQRHVADVVLSLSGEAVRARLKVAYVVPCALWRPSHEARLSRTDDGSARVAWASFATVWQKTGEDWDDVELALSTARPSQGAELPSLSPDRLSLRDKTAEERKRIVVEHRVEAVPKGDLEGAAPGVYDGGEPRWFSSPGRVRIPSDGRPHRVATFETESEARLAQVAMPELSPHVFLRASLRNPSAHPILAGPVTLLSDGAWVGVGDVPYVGSGESFDLSFGSDDRFRVKLRRRRVVEERTLAKDRVHFVTHVDLSYTGERDERVTVLLRMPKSELAQLKVLPSPAYCSEGTPAPDEHGIVNAPLSFTPGQARTLSLGFHFDTSGDVVLPDPW